MNGSEPSKFSQIHHIGVLGAGAWGTALAQAMASDGSQVLLWAREAELVEEVNQTHTNSLFLPGAILSQQIRATGDLSQLAALPVLLAVVPAQHLAEKTAGQVAQLALRPWGLQVQLIYVALDVEVGVSFPVGMAQVERRPDRELTVTREKVEFRLDVPHEPSEGNLAVEH